MTPILQSRALHVPIPINSLPLPNPPSSFRKKNVIRILLLTGRCLLQGTFTASAAQLLELYALNTFTFLPPPAEFRASVSI